MTPPRRRMVCDAVPFGFGPASKLVSVLRRLPPTIDVVVLGTGSTAELVTSSLPDVDFRMCDTESMSALSPHRELVQQSDLFLSVMNPIALRWAQSQGSRTATMDSLFWMWDRVPREFAAADHYFIQRFSGVEAKLSQADMPIRNPLLVGPILDDFGGRWAPANELLLNLGGLRSSAIDGNESRYERLVAGIIRGALADHPFRAVRVAGGSDGLASLAAEAGIRAIPGIALESLSHRGYMESLSRAAVLLSSPGLTATLEAFGMGVPVVFLPPQNYSQSLILETLWANGAAAGTPPWSDIAPDIAPRAGLPETEGIATALRCVSTLTRDPTKLAQVVAHIADALTSRTGLAALARRQSRYLDRLGGDGAGEIVSRISTTLGVD